MRVTARLPYPPTVNHYWEHTVRRKGRRYFPHIYTSDEGKSYRRNVVTIMRDSPKLIGLVRVMLIAHPPDKRTRDLDNIQKCLLDALEHAGVYDNDSQIDELAVVRGEVVRGGAVEIVVESIDDFVAMEV